MGTQQFQPKEALNFLDEIFHEKDTVWWFALCLTGGGLKIEESKNYEDVMKSIGLSDDNLSYIKDISKWQRGWGNLGSGFPRIYNKIELLYQWK